MSLMIKPGSGVPTPPEVLKEIFSDSEEERQMRFTEALDNFIEFGLEYWGRKSLIRFLNIEGPLSEEDIIYLGIVDTHEEFEQIYKEICEDIDRELEECRKRKGLAVLD